MNHSDAATFAPDYEKKYLIRQNGLLKGEVWLHESEIEDVREYCQTEHGATLSEVLGSERVISLKEIGKKNNDLPEPAEREDGEWRAYHETKGF